MIRKIITNIIGHADLDLFEHPELVDIIVRCRPIVTRESLNEEVEYIYSVMLENSEK